MQVDPEYLRQHYASLSDEALLEIDRAELVEIAQTCLDDEISQRGLDSVGEATHVNEPLVGDEELEYDHEPRGEGDTPGWLEEGAEVYSAVGRRGAADAPDAVVDARDVLEAAGIPCHLDLCEDQPETNRSPEEPTHRWRLMVPGQLIFRAASVLDRDIFNADFEAGWRTHLEALSDQEVRAMNPQVVFCGLFDRMERVTRAYREEISRRGLASKS
jgi:hypothetical protein